MIEQQGGGDCEPAGYRGRRRQEKRRHVRDPHQALPEEKEANED
jgi:hypothetical protein